MVWTLIRGCHQILVAVEGKWMVHGHDEHILVVVLREENGCTAILRKDMDQAPVDHDMLVPLSQKGQPSGSYAMMDEMRPDTAHGMTAPLISRRLMYCSHGWYFSLYQQRKPSYTRSGARRTLGSCVGRAKTRCTAREIAWFYWYTEVQYNNVKKTCIALLLLGQRVYSLR